MNTKDAYRLRHSDPWLEEDEPEQFARCPFLGTANDPDTALPFASEEHRCFSAAFPVPVSATHQKKYCLTAQYGLCPVFRARKEAELAAEAASASVEVVSPSAEVAPLPAPKSRPVVIKPDPVEVASPPVEDISSPALEPTPAILAIPETPVTDDDVQEMMSASAGDRVLWLDPGDDMLTEMSALFGVGRAASSSSPAPAGGSPTLSWGDQVHPDFITNNDDYLPRQGPRSTIFRRFMVVLLSLGIVLAGWWFFSNAPAYLDLRPISYPVREIAMTVLPPAGDGSDIGDDDDSLGGLAMTPASIAAAPGVAEPTATPTTEPLLTDLEQVAMTATALFSGAPLTMECAAPSTWVSYVIERGDTIESLARSRGVQRELLIVANCLAQSKLEVGRTIFLPPVSVVATATIEATSTPTPLATAVIQATRAPVFFPTTVPVQFPTAVIPIYIFPTMLPTTLPTTLPTAAPPPTSAPPAPAPTDVPKPTAAPTIEPTAPPPQLPTDPPPEAVSPDPTAPSP